MRNFRDIPDEHRYGDEPDEDDWYGRDDYREPDPEDYEIAKAEHEHSETVHGGRPCDCPVPTEEEIAAQWAEEDRKHRAEVHGGGECRCEPPF